MPFPVVLERVYFDNKKEYYITPKTPEAEIIMHEVDEVAYSPALVSLLDRACDDEYKDIFKIVDFLEGKFYVLEYEDYDDPILLITVDEKFVEEIKKMNEEASEMSEKIREEFDKLEKMKISDRAYKCYVENKVEEQLNAIAEELQKMGAEIPRARP